MNLRKYFLGSLPPGIILNEDMQLIKKQLENLNDGEKLLELLLVGLVSYAEAFFKNLFASTINIFPELAFDKDFKVKFELDDIIYYRLNVENNLGSLIASKINFNNAEEIDKHFSQLLSIKPFIREDYIKYYFKIKSTKNLYSHHAGIINQRTKGIGNFYFNKPLDQHFLSLQVSEVKEAVSFIENVAKNFLITLNTKLNDIFVQNESRKHYIKVKIERLTNWESLLKPVLQDISLLNIEFPEVVEKMIELLGNSEKYFLSTENKNFRYPVINYKRALKNFIIFSQYKYKRNDIYFMTHVVNEYVGDLRFFDGQLEFILKDTSETKPFSEETLETFFQEIVINKKNIDVDRMIF